MLEKINESVSVKLVYDGIKKTVYPSLITWRGKNYKIKTVGLRHFYKKGDTLFHIFSITDGNLFFRLKLNTSNLHWFLEEVADGETT